MANHEPNKTDPLWFLDNLEDEESKLKSNTLTDNENSNDGPGNGINSDNAQNSDIIQLMKDSAEAELLSGNSVQNKLIEDEISLKSELEKSLFDLAKESIEKGNNPEFRITISSNNENSAGNGHNADNVQSILNSDDSSNQDNQNSKFRITPSMSVGDKTINIGSENINENVNKDINKPKIFIIVKSNQNADSKGNIALENIRNNQICSEIGSSVINLNDFISPQSKPVTGRENISTSVNFLGNDGEKKKVELVITIKDERSKPTEKTTTRKTYVNEINTDFPTVDSLLNDESVDAKRKRLNKRIQKLSNNVRRSDSWYTSKVSKVDTQDDWSETKDSYIRESDGARCYRTVTNSPQGRKVQTQCYTEDRRGGRRHNNYGWTTGFGSFWDDLDYEFDRMFSQMNRLMFF